MITDCIRQEIVALGEDRDFGTLRRNIAGPKADRSTGHQRRHSRSESVDAALSESELSGKLGRQVSTGSNGLCQAGCDGG